MFIDFAVLKQSLTIEQAVSILGLEMKQEGNALRGVCPACNRGGDRALIVTPSKSAWYCHALQKGGDLISLAAHIRGESVKDAAAFLADFTGTVQDKVQGTVKVPSTSSQVSGQHKGFDRAKYQASLDRKHDLLKDVPPDIVERADLGVSNRGSHKGLISVPLYDQKTGEFLCYVGVDAIHFPNNVVPLKKTG